MASLRNEELAAYLDHSAKLRRQSIPAEMQGDIRYACAEEFVLKHGRAYQSPAKDYCLPNWRGRMKMCFLNATVIALRCLPLTYVEGFAINLVPCAHAWVINPKGQVIDPTWTDAPNAVYYGVAFRTAFLRQQVVESGYYGLLNGPYSVGSTGLLRGLYKPEELLRNPKRRGQHDSTKLDLGCC